MIRLFIPGKPATAGSKSVYRTPQGKTIVAPASKYTKPWMEAVKYAAIKKGYNGKLIIRGPIRLTCTFYFLRPKSHYGTGRNKDILKQSAPQHKTTIPDLTKHVRAIEDSLTGLIWRDDSQVVEQINKKLYGEPQGAEIIIEEIGE